MTYKNFGHSPPNLKIRNENRVCYLLLHLGIPSSMIPASSVKDLEFFKTARLAGRKFNIIVDPIRIFARDDGLGNHRYVIRFKRNQRNDLQALRFTEAIILAVSILYGPWIEPDETATAFRFPAELIHGDQISLEDLVQIEESRNPIERITDFPDYTLSKSFITSPSFIDTAWKITPLLALPNKLHRAALFLNASQDSFYVGLGGLDEAIDNSEYSSESSSDQLRFENALLNAYKAIEAVIGDPPNDDKKLFSKLREIGIDPHEEVGYLTKLPIYKVIRNMSDARNKKAAHGSTIDRIITVGEMLEFQACSRHIVLSAIEHLFGKDLF